MSGVSEYCWENVLGDIGDTRFGKDGGIIGLELLGNIIGVVPMLLVVVVMAGLDGGLWGGIL